MFDYVLPELIAPNRHAFDTEFIVKRGELCLISLGLVKIATGERLYLLHPRAEELRAYAAEAEPWISKHVFDDAALLAHAPERPASVEALRQRVIEFCGPSPQFWAYIAGYDKVAMTQGLFGSMMQAPKDWPYAVNDLATPLALAKRRKDDYTPDAELSELPEHNALCDALLVARIYRTLMADGYAGRLVDTVTSQAIVKVLQVAIR